MSASTVDWFPIPGKEDLNLPLSQGAAYGDLVLASIAAGDCAMRALETMAMAPAMHPT